jgi:hypothetical protein
LLFDGVSVACYCHQIFSRCHNFVCVIFTSRIRRVGCNFLLRDQFIRSFIYVNTLLSIIFGYLPSGDSRLVIWICQFPQNYAIDFLLGSVGNISMGL